MQIYSQKYLPPVSPNGRYCFERTLTGCPSGIKVLVCMCYCDVYYFFDYVIFVDILSLLLDYLRHNRIQFHFTKSHILGSILLLAFFIGNIVLLHSASVY